MRGATRVKKTALLKALIYVGALFLVISHSGQVIAQTGIAWDPPLNQLPINLSNDLTFSSEPQIAVSGNNVSVVWVNGTGNCCAVFFRRSTDGGVTWEPIQTLSITQTAGNPRIIANGNNVYVAWEEQTPVTFSDDVYFSRSTDAGATFSPPLNLSAGVGSLANPSFGVPDIAVIGTTIYVVWGHRLDAVSHIFFRRSTDAGVTWSSIFHVSTIDGIGLTNLFPRIAAVGTNVVVAWLAAFGGPPFLFVRHSPDGGVTWNPPLDSDPENVSAIPGNSGTFPQLAATEDALYVLWVLWEDLATGNLDIFFRRGVVGSTTMTPVVLVHGWCGSPSEGTWGQMQSLLGGVGINADYTDYGNDTEPDLARLAGRLSAEIDRVLQDQVLNPTGGTQVDVVAHSMGGLVARSLVANMAVDDAGNSISYRNQIRKLIEIASPNYGVPFGSFEAAVLGRLFGCNTDFGVRQQQAKQLKFGSHFLWVLHGKWSTTLLAQEQKSDVLTIVGTGNQFFGSDFVVPIESAALSDVGVMARYVDRTHGDIADVDASHETLSLVKHFLLTGNDPPESECGLAKCIRSLDPNTPGMLLFRLIDSGTRKGINLRTSFVTTVDGVIVGGESGIIAAIKNTDPGASTFTIRPLSPSPPLHSVIVEPVTLRYHPGELNGIEITPGRTTIFGELALERE